MGEIARNYRIVGLVPQQDHYTVEIEVQPVCSEPPCRDCGRWRCECEEPERRDSGVRASEWGLYGLTRNERDILRRGMTASGRDRAPKRRDA